MKRGSDYLLALGLLLIGCEKGSTPAAADPMEPPTGTMTSDGGARACAETCTGLHRLASYGGSVYGLAIGGDYAYFASSAELVG